MSINLNPLSNDPLYSDETCPKGFHEISPEMKPCTLLVTGAAGFIGSHTILELMAAGFHVIGIDNFSNSQASVLEGIEKIKPQLEGSIQPDFKVLQMDVRNAKDLTRLFEDHEIEGVVHFAGLKSVAESFLHPLDYWSNNVGGTMTLLGVMKDFNVRNFVFSSSALVYGQPKAFPILESSPTEALSPYANSKLVCEQLLRDFSKANSEWNITLLRYFNPVGAHPSGLMGELPSGTPHNLMPFLSQVAAGLRDQLFVFGSDYDTPDGTCIRDYLHVVDLAKGHVAALQGMLAKSKHSMVKGSNALSSDVELNLQPIEGLQTFNLGTGQGVSVLEMVETFARVNGVEIKHTLVDKRTGDVPVLYADASRAQKLLGWKAEKSLAQMCQDAWRWQCHLTSPRP